MSGSRSPNVPSVPRSICAKLVCKIDTVGPDMIFERQLAEPRDCAKNPDAIASAMTLAFADPRHIIMRDAGCTELQFHVVTRRTLALDLNNHVYLMTR